MAVISISIIESEEQIVAGIPKTVKLTSNIPATIFYTLDGSVPTLSSYIYTDTIFLPFEKLSITLSILATNGTDSSPIITETYTTNILNNTRLPHSTTSAAPGDNIANLYPFGDAPRQPNGAYLNPGDAGVTVDDPTLSSIATGFDASGNPNGFTNEPYNIENYQIQYSTTDAIGQTGPEIGNLPASVKIKQEEPVPETSQQFSNLFDPRAFVIFQDFDTEDPNDPPQINKQFFILDTQEKSRDGNGFFTTGLDAPPVNGTFLRSHYNPRTNKISYYYLDTWSNRWIISTQEYKPTGNFDGNLARVALSNKPGAGFIYEFIPYARRVLF